MKRSIKMIAVAAMASVLFFAGMGTGIYQLWPYHLLHEAKNDLERYMDPLNQFTQVNTGLQYLLIKKKKLPQTVGNGGAMGVAGNLVFILTRHGRLLAFDWGSAKSLENNVTVPMGLQELENSDIVNMDTFTLEHFRVHGVYVERRAPDYYRMYVTHHFYANGCITFQLSRLDLQKADNTLRQAGAWSTLFETTPCMDPLQNAQRGFYAFSGHAAGGRIIPYDQHYLLVSVGDHQFDGRGREMYAQDPDVPYGKIMIINKETGVASVFALGVRNPQGLMKDDRGRIWETEHGPQGGGELNLIREGRNYGWPLNTYGIQYGNLPWEPAIEQGRHENYTKPVFSWMPSIGPTNLVAIDGPKFKSWQGDLLIGSMPAKSLFRLRLDSNRVVYSEQIYLGHRIRDLETLPNGSIGMITDDAYLLIMEDGGAVYDQKSNPQEITAALNKFDELNFDTTFVRPPFTTASVMEGNKRMSVQYCLKCHSVTKPRLDFAGKPNEEKLNFKTDTLAIAEQSEKEWKESDVLELLKGVNSDQK